MRGALGLVENLALALSIIWYYTIAIDKRRNIYESLSTSAFVWRKFIHLLDGAERINQHDFLTEDISMRYGKGYGKPTKNSKRADAYIAEILAVSAKHGLSMSHEDEHGSFEIVRHNERWVKWLSDAIDRT
jgi:hypothetical protein